jgi:hypothetical protein
MEKKKIYFLGSVLIAFLGVGCQKAPINQPLPQKNTPKSTIETSELDKISPLVEKCANGTFSACNELDQKDILQLKASCLSGNNKACEAIGASLFTEGNYTEIKKIGESACKKGVGGGCTILGALYFAGKGVPRDVEKAKSLFEKGCQLGSGVGCVDRGSTYILEQNPSKAVELYKKACDMGYGIGCYSLGIMYFTGKGVSQDREKAKALLEKGCQMGSEPACKTLEDIKGRE